MEATSRDDILTPEEAARLVKINYKTNSIFDGLGTGTRLNISCQYRNLPKMLDFKWIS